MAIEPVSTRHRARRHLARALACAGVGALLVTVLVGQSQPAVAAGVFATPADGQSITFEGDYVFKAATVTGATGYLIRLYQNGVLRVENQRDLKSVAQKLVLRRGNPLRTRLLPNIATKATVRARVNGQWTPQSAITVYLRPAQTKVKVLELRYFPLDANGNLDAVETEFPGYTLAQIKAHVDAMSSGTLRELERSTVYVKQPAIGKYIDYVKVASIELDVKVPRSTTFIPFADHYKVLNPQNICNWVDNKGVRDVWIWMYHTQTIAPNESNMSMGRQATAYYNHGTYGDISNSWQTDDLPVCNHTYVVYNFNYTRGVPEALHNYAHQRERMWMWGDYDLFTRFVNPYGAALSGTRACGGAHDPPNSRFGYDYDNPGFVPSNCSDWHPDGSGAVQQVSCSTWGCANAHAGFLVWWAQRAPGRGTTLSWGGVRMRNWNELIADFDSAAKLGRRLTE